MTTTDDGGNSDDPFDRPTELRDEVEPAEPEPVTEAMITPRTEASRTSAPGGEEACRVCGELNQAGATYCLSCGVRIGPDIPTTDGEPPPWQDEDDDVEFDAGAGLMDLGEMDALGEPESGPDTDTEPPQPTPPRITGRHIAIGAIAAAILLLLVVTFTGSEPDEPATTTSSVAVDQAALDLYLAGVSDVADTVADLHTEALAVNAAWDERSADYEATLAALSSLESRATALPDLLSVLESPESVGAAMHQRLLDSVTTVADAAQEMVVGLEAPDTGEARQAALAKLEAGAVEFAGLARSVVGAANPATVPNSG